MAEFVAQEVGVGGRSGREARRIRTLQVAGREHGQPVVPQPDTVAQGREAVKAQPAAFGEGALAE
ncbi:hypothetical protein HRW23_28025 [Streptomyces lunaelactis]|uniref:hypothetical protein n=1 Tax=Streptomyces lunaelactis TaxID=1535768 RepID=UPI00158480BB|nr:hypothetical protein [Streptomyces lunaelactis]NUK70342.1 hypothetical protein [Streptomyces lunaelactis]NUK81167.1 hypothetical protein [Streptomyces lunaelactis]